MFTITALISGETPQFPNDPGTVPYPYLNVNNLPLTTAQTQGLKERPPLGSLLDPIFPCGKAIHGYHAGVLQLH